MTTNNNNQTFVVSEEDAKKLENIQQLNDSTLETLKMYMSAASKIYNLFCKSGLNSAEGNVDKWKKFEHDMVRLIYEAVGESNPPEQVCSITALVNAFGLSLATVASLEIQVEDLKKKLEKING